MPSASSARANPTRHALDRVRVHFDRGAKESPVGFDKKVPAANEKSLRIERLSPGGGELILGGLIDEHGVGLHEPTDRQSGLADSQTPRRTRSPEVFQVGRRRLLGQGGLRCPDQKESTRTCEAKPHSHGM
jgi:hypothetical protein